MIKNDNIAEKREAITKEVVPTPMVTFYDETTTPEASLSHENLGAQSNYVQYNYCKFAKEFMARNSIVKLQGILYLYLQERGYYHPLVIGASDIPVRMQMPSDMQDRCNNTTINEMIKWLYAWIGEYVGNYNNAEHVNFKNGYLDITTSELHPHSSNAVFTYVLNVDYVSDMNDTPVFDEFLSNICYGQMGLDNLLAEHFGYIISNIRSVKLISVLYGPSNTGKSTWLELLNMVIGDEFTKAIPLQNLSGNFRTIELLGSRLNTFSEIDNFKLNDTYMIKTLSSGGDRINCDVKNGKPVDFINLAALVFASNTLENFKLIGRKDAIYQRLLIIPFLNQINTNKRIIGLLVLPPSQPDFCLT
jgi:P4 family phage/plasmid primase-like protien